MFDIHFITSLSYFFAFLSSTLQNHLVQTQQQEALSRAYVSGVIAFELIGNRTKS
jgi:hypothetical protein